MEAPLQVVEKYAENLLKDKNEWAKWSPTILKELNKMTNEKLRDLINSFPLEKPQTKSPVPKPTKPDPIATLLKKDIEILDGGVDPISGTGMKLRIKGGNYRVSYSGFGIGIDSLRSEDGTPISNDIIKLIKENEKEIVQVAMELARHPRPKSIRQPITRPQADEELDRLKQIYLSSEDRDKIANDRIFKQMNERGFANELGAAFFTFQSTIDKVANEYDKWVLATGERRGHRGSENDLDNFILDTHWIFNYTMDAKRNIISFFQWILDVFGQMLKLEPKYLEFVLEKLEGSGPYGSEFRNLAREFFKNPNADPESLPWPDLFAKASQNPNLLLKSGKVPTSKKPPITIPPGETPPESKSPIIAPSNIPPKN